MAHLDALVNEIHRSERPRELDLVALAERQHGVVARDQLRELGFGPGAIQYRLDTGRLHRIHPGVYAVGRPSLTREGHWMAAVLAGGPGALLSHLSAAALWGLLRDHRRKIDVTAPGRRRHSRGELVVHNVRRLHADDGDRLEGIRLTSVARTLLDLAEVVSPRRLARAIDEAERLGLFDLRAVDELCARSRGRRGLRALRRAIAGYRPMPAFTRSELERRFVEICDRAGLRRPAMNLFVAGYEVDAIWPDRNLAVEVDSYEFHRTRAAFEADRARDAALQRQGIRVLRVIDRRLVEDPGGVAVDLRALHSLPRLVLDRPAMPEYEMGEEGVDDAESDVGLAQQE